MNIITLKGLAVIDKLCELHARNIPVRSMTQGRTASEWILAWDDGSIQPEIFPEKDLTEQRQNETNNPHEHN